jgi:hypothetical protein
MPLEKNPERKTRPVAFSFRLSESGAEKLRVLSAVFNETQVRVIETLLADGYEDAKKRYPKEVAKAEKKKRS